MNEVLSPEKIGEEAKLLFSLGKYPQAAEGFLNAANSFEAAGDMLSRAEMFNNRAVALLKAKKPEEALAALEGMDVVFEEAGDRRRQAMTLGNRGSVLEELKRYEEAREAYDRASEIFKEIGERELREPVLRALAGMQLRTGKPLESYASFNAGLGETEGLPKWRIYARKVLQWLLKLPQKFILRT